MAQPLRLWHRHGGGDGGFIMMRYHRQFPPRRLSSSRSYHGGGGVTTMPTKSMLSTTKHHSIGMRQPIMCYTHLSVVGSTKTMTQPTYKRMVTTISGRTLRASNRQPAALSRQMVYHHHHCHHPTTSFNSVSALAVVAVPTVAQALWNALNTTMTTTTAAATASCENAINDLVPETNMILAATTTTTTTTTTASWKQRLRRAWRMIRRLLKLMVTLTPVVAFYPILLLSHHRDPAIDAQDVVLGAVPATSSTTSSSSISSPHSSWSRWLLQQYLQLCLYSAEQSGAAVIKLCQWAGGRPDLFGYEFCSVFAQLQDHTTPHAWRYTSHAMTKAYGSDWYQRLELDDIIGSGCIGQVYRGYILTDEDEEDDEKHQLNQASKNISKAKQSSPKWDLESNQQDHRRKRRRGRQVAVKVLHPGVEEDIAADLDLMRFTVGVLQSLPWNVFGSLKWLNLQGVVEEFADLLQLQLDLRHEANNLERFGKHFASNKYIEFPLLVPEFPPTQHVLVESFLEGIPVLQYARQHQHDRTKLSQMCVHAIRAVCQMIFLDNFVHGDLHPGNVRVSADGQRFLLFDVGIVAEYSERDHVNLVDILAAFIRKQGRKAGRHLIDDSNQRLQLMRRYSTATSSQHERRRRYQYETQGISIQDDNERKEHLLVLTDDIKAEAAIDEESFIDKIEALTIRASSSEYLMEHLGVYISYICQAAATHHVMLNPAFVSAALAVKVQEGIALALDPSIEIWKVATPIIIESERRRGIQHVKDKVHRIGAWWRWFDTVDPTPR